MWEYAEEVRETIANRKRGSDPIGEETLIRMSQSHAAAFFAEIAEAAGFETTPAGPASN
jgi:hypothetical protein